MRPLTALFRWFIRCLNFFIDFSDFSDVEREEIRKMARRCKSESLRIMIRAKQKGLR